MAREATVPISFRISPSGLDWFEDLKIEHPQIEAADRTDIIKAALVVAKRHQPELVETIRERL